MVVELLFMLLITSPSQSSPLVLTPFSFQQFLFHLNPFGQFVVSVLYRLHSSPVSFFDKLSLVLKDLCTPLYSRIFGDFNVDASVPGYLCNYLYNVANLHPLTIIPTGHTRV